MAELGGGPMELVVVIINYGTPQCTIECLESLARERTHYTNFKVLLVDNASKDDSTAQLSRAIVHNQWSHWISLLPQTRNLGFAGGNNAAIRDAFHQPVPPEFLLLLNSDSLVHPNCLRTAVNRMRNNPKIGALSCMVRNTDGTIQNVCRKFPNPLLETCRTLGFPYLFPKLFSWADTEDPCWNRVTTARAVDWIGGAFMLLRASAVRTSGPLDESFFFYGEDTELCHRLFKNGWLVFFDPTAEITHLGGASSSPSQLQNRQKVQLAWNAKLQVQQKCYGKISALWMRAIYLIAISLNLLSLWATGRKGSTDWLRSALNLSILLRP